MDTQSFQVLETINIPFQEKYMLWVYVELSLLTWDSSGLFQEA